MSDVRRQIEALERSKPDAKTDPETCRMIDAEIARVIDRARAWKSASGRRVA